MVMLKPCKSTIYKLLALTQVYGFTYKYKIMLLYYYTLPRTVTLVAPLVSFIQIILPISQKVPKQTDLGMQFTQGTKGHALLSEKFLFHVSRCEQSGIQSGSHEVTQFAQAFIEGPDIQKFMHPKKQFLLQGVVREHSPMLPKVLKLTNCDFTSISKQIQDI